jgi:hypothetical protein
VRVSARRPKELLVLGVTRKLPESAGFTVRCLQPLRFVGTCPRQPLEGDDVAREAPSDVRERHLDAGADRGPLRGRLCRKQSAVTCGGPRTTPAGFRQRTQGAGRQLEGQGLRTRLLAIGRARARLPLGNGQMACSARKSLLCGHRATLSGRDRHMQRFPKSRGTYALSGSLMPMR